jgi:glycosyltransferase involved in cell wall biosynthesis
MIRKHIDILIDLSNSPDRNQIQQTVRSIASDDGLAALAGDIRCLLPAGSSGIDWGHEPAVWKFIEAADAHATAAKILETSGGETRHLLILLGAIMPGNEAVATLIEGLERDPMFGFALPRMEAADGAGIEKIDFDLGDPEIVVIPRRVLADLPDIYIVPECLGPCMLVRNDLLANLGTLDFSFQTLAGALLHFMCRARRIGYRVVVLNRAIIPHCPPKARSATPHSTDLWKLMRMYPDISRSRAEMMRLPLHAYEGFLARATASNADLRRTLLIDGHGMGDCFNGTSQCVLGIADGLASLSHSWRVTLLATRDAARFHDLSRRYPDWEIVHEISSCRATAAVRVSQPWAISTLLEMHRQALFNFYLVLDTISWDILFDAPEGLDSTWRFLATYADGLLFISNFARDRFRMRFPLAPGMREYTLYLSLHPEDYIHPSTRSSGSKEPYILVVGNHYDHKNLLPTVDLLATCFPFQSIKAVGLRGSEYPQVKTIASGTIPEVEMDHLYAHARLIVFPSHYEGFGLPVVRGLSYGGTVLARHSALLEEIAANYRGPGCLLSFRNPLELIENTGRVLHNHSVPKMPLGNSLQPGEAPLNWTAIARNLVQFIERATDDPGTSRWLCRERALQQILAYRG